MTFGPIFIDHIGIATHDLDPASRFWELIGLVQGDSDEVVADQGVKTPTGTELGAVFSPIHFAVVVPSWAVNRH